jgi:hypothetical protein
MATIGRLVELLRTEARVAEESSEQASHERLREMADDIGEMSAEQREWVEQANDDELRGFVKAVRMNSNGGA